MEVFSAIILLLLIVYFLFWIEVFKDPRYMEVERRLVEEFSQGKKMYRRYEILFVVCSLNEILKSLIKNERRFYIAVGIMVMFSLLLMFVGILMHFGIISFKFNLDKVIWTISRMFGK